jgi:UDP-glucose 4-epimerase
VSKFINSKKEQEPLTIYGSGYQRRDFIHVSDVVTANALVTYQNIEQWGEVYNIGFGKNWSVQEIADHLYEDQIHLEGRPGEMSETLLDISKAWVDLNWKPKVNMMDWIRTQL